MGISFQRQDLAGYSWHDLNAYPLSSLVKHWQTIIGCNRMHGLLSIDSRGSEWKMAASNQALALTTTTTKMPSGMPKGSTNISSPRGNFACMNCARHSDPPK